MGWQATGWAFKAPIENSGCKFVLVALAERAGNEDDDAPTWECFPSIETIQKYTAQGYRTIQRHLDWLEANGFITRERRTISKGKKGAYNYTLHRFPTPVDKMAGGQIEPEDRPEDAPNPAPIGRTEPVIGTGDRTDVVVAQARSPFEAWWLLYPRRVAKAPAKAAFDKAMGLVSVADLCAATVRFADEVKDRPRDKIPHPATWLNAERWTDEPEANRSQTDVRRDQSTGPLDRGAARANAHVDAMVAGAREAHDRRSADRAEQRRRWGFGHPADSHKPHPSGGGRAALPAPAGSGEGEA